MATRRGRKSCAIIGRLITTLLVLALGGGSTVAETVQAENYNAFWLWAGVQPQSALSPAKEIYLLAGEVSGRGGAHIVTQRSATPHIHGPQVWIVYRAQTVEWNGHIMQDVLAHLEAWPESHSLQPGWSPGSSRLR